MQYQTNFEVERVDPEVFAHLSEEMTLDASRGRLFHCFTPANRMASAPISHLLIDAGIKSLSVHTFHSFPDESRDPPHPIAVRAAHYPPHAMRSDLPGIAHPIPRDFESQI